VDIAPDEQEFYEQTLPDGQQYALAIKAMESKTGAKWGMKIVFSRADGRDGVEQGGGEGGGGEGGCRGGLWVSLRACGGEWRAVQPEPLARRAGDSRLRHDLPLRDGRADGHGSLPDRGTNDFLVHPPSSPGVPAVA
jgi:hypothetical protein